MFKGFQGSGFFNHQLSINNPKHPLFPTESFCHELHEWALMFLCSAIIRANS